MRGTDSLTKTAFRSKRIPLLDGQTGTESLGPIGGRTQDYPLRRIGLANFLDNGAIREQYARSAKKRAMVLPIALFYFLCTLRKTQSEPRLENHRGL